VASWLSNIRLQRTALGAAAEPWCWADRWLTSLVLELRSRVVSAWPRSQACYFTSCSGTALLAM